MCYNETSLEKGRKILEIRPGRRIQISIYKTEPTNPTIFLIHGLGGRGYQWREQIKHLQQQYNLIVPDLLGQGNSEKPLPQTNDIYSFPELNKDVQAIFEYFAGEKNFVFGHSYGGALSVFLAYNNPKKIQKLVLISPVVCTPFKAVPLAYFLPTPLLMLLRNYLDKSFEKLAFSSFENAELLKIEKEGRDLNSIEIIKALLMGMEKIPQLDVSQLSVPSLVVGGKEDKIIPPFIMENFYSRLPHRQILILEQAAHMVHLERSVEVNRLLDDFLGKEY